MRESIHKYFQVGTIRWMSFPNRSVVDQVKRVAVDDYFDAIEVTKCADDAEREEVKKILEQSHLKVCYGAQPRLLGPKLLLVVLISAANFAAYGAGPMRAALSISKSNTSSSTFMPFLAA